MLRNDTPFVHVDSPFTVHLAQGVLAEDAVAELYAAAPVNRVATISRSDPEHEKQYRMNLFYLMVNNQRSKRCAELPQIWHSLVDSLTSDAFVSWLSEGTGLELRGLSQDICIYTHVDGDYLSVHKDKPDKAITAILYLNPEWPTGAGGEFEIRFGADPESSHSFRLPPRPGQLLAFPPTDQSWHAVSRVSGGEDLTRLTVQLEYWFDHVDRYRAD